MNDMREETSERYEGHAGIQLLSAGKDKQRDRDRRGEPYLVGVRVLQLDSLHPTHVVQISAVRREGKGNAGVCYQLHHLLFVQCDGVLHSR
jgi:hypothetical protein